MRYVLRGLGPPHPKQLEILGRALEPSPDVKQIDVCCGRGFGKTVFGIIVALKALCRGPDEVGLFLEPDWKRVHRVFLKKWFQHVPKALYTINKGECCITLYNGAKLYYGPRNITGRVQDSEDSQLGQDTSFIIDDEAALKCNFAFYRNNLMTIRVPSEARFYLTLTTPRLGDYQTLVTDPEHELFHGSSWDNVYLPPGTIDGWVRNMSAAQVSRDIDGQFVAVDDLIWSEWSNDPWPMGNVSREHSEFMPELPYYLFCDFGSGTGAYVVVQPTYIRNEEIWVAVADLCPHMDASASRAFQKIKAMFGDPEMIVGGADSQTRSNADGRTIRYYSNQIFGPGIPVKAMNEQRFSKSIQYDKLSYLIKDYRGFRRFCIAENFVSLDTQSRRGLKEMFEQDQWLEESKRREGDFLPKNKEIRVQHVRDALLMGAAGVMSPPTFFDSGEIAA